MRRLVPVVEVEGGEGQQQGARPDDGADEAAVGQRAKPEAAASLDDGDVAVGADAGEQQHAAVQIHAVAAAQQLAGHRPHRPRRQLVVHDERQRHHEQQVGDGHVEQVNVGHGLGPLVEGVGDDHQDVSHEAQDADDGVDVRADHQLQAAVLLLRTRSVRVVIKVRHVITVVRLVELV